MADQQILEGVHIVDVKKWNEGSGPQGPWVRYAIKIDDADWGDIEFRYFYRSNQNNAWAPVTGGPVALHFTEEDYQGTPQYVIRKVVDPRGSKPKPRPKPRGPEPAGAATGATSNGDQARVWSMLCAYRKDYLMATRFDTEGAPMTPDEMAQDLATFAHLVVRYGRVPELLPAFQKKKPPAPNGAPKRDEPPPDDDIPF